MAKSRKAKAPKKKSATTLTFPDKTVAVVGDAWTSTFAYYLPTSLVPSTNKIFSVLGTPQFDTTSIDIEMLDGTFVTASLLQNVLNDDKGKRKYQAVATQAAYSLEVNRLINLRDYDRTESTGNDKRVRRVGEVKFLSHASPINSDPTEIKKINKPHSCWLPYSKKRWLQVPKKHQHEALLVVDDHGNWRSGGRDLPLLKKDAPIVVVLGTSLPKYDKSNNRFEDPGWQQLADAKREVIVVLSASMLRYSRAHIRRHLSWEQSIEDLLDECNNFPALRTLASMHRVVVRFGTSAVAVLQQRKSKHNDRSSFIVFEPNLLPHTQRNRQKDGIILGKSGMLAACIIQEQISNKGSDIHPGSIKKALAMMQRRFERGYLEEKKIGKKRHSLKRLLKNPLIDDMATKPFVFGNSLLDDQKAINDTQRRFGCCEFEIPPRGKRARINFFQSSLVKSNGKSASRYGLINIAEAIVFGGHKKVLNCCEWAEKDDENAINKIIRRDRFKYEKTDLRGRSVSKIYDINSIKSAGNPESIYVPVLSCGRLVSIDRNEIEWIRSVRNLISSYVQSDRELPVSFAVFGKPGSGKSFAVKQIAKELNAGGVDGAKTIAVSEFNLSQLRSTDDLEEMSNVIREANLNNTVPLVFVDEFDSSTSEGKYGWLKYFLSPMNDGTFRIRGKDGKTGKVIFCFAGGTCHTFQEFAALDSTADFVSAKGPDFVSRLRGFINVMPLSVRKANKPILRRAILLRSLMEQFNRVERYADGIDRAMIDEDIVFALLTISKYRHEARSLQAIIEMCVPFNGRIAKVSLPTTHHLDMHVDSKEFFKRMARSRRRPRAWD